MNKKIMLIVILLLALSGAFGPQPVVAQTPAVRYQFIDLGTLNGTDSYFTALNDHNQVLGRIATAGIPDHTFLWKRGIMQDLYPIYGIDINNMDEILSTERINDTVHLVTYNSGQRTDLGVVDLEEFWVEGFNDSGQAMGLTPEPDEGFWQPFLWDHGVIYHLMGQSPGDDGWPEAINRPGQVAFNTCDSTCAYVWSAGQRTRLSSPPNFGASFVIDLNDKGQAVGYSFAHSSGPGWVTAIFWKPDGSPVRLRTWDGYGSSANGINNKGQIVGELKVLNANREVTKTKAIVWQTSGSKLVLLPLPKGYRSSVALAINWNGYIAGEATTHKGATHVVVWKPIAAP